MQKRIEIMLVVVIVGVALAFGGVQPIVYSLMEVVLFLAMLLAILKPRREDTPRLQAPIWLALFAALVLLQIVPLPFWIVTRAFACPGPRSETRGSFSRSVALDNTEYSYPHDTLLNLIKFLAYFSAFLLAAYVFDSGKEEQRRLCSWLWAGRRAV